MATRLATCLLLAAAMSSCTVPLPDGPFSCKSGADCLAGFCAFATDGKRVCGAPDNSCEADPAPCRRSVSVPGGGCLPAPANEGEACPIDVCGGGLCQDGSCVRDAVCDDGLDCSVDTCHPERGCEHDRSACPCESDSDCDDGDACNGVWACNGGTCAQLEPTLDCSALANACTSATCEPATGACVTQALLAESCDDGLVCTVDDVCQSDGNCVGVTLACPPGDPCTTVSCEEPAGCVYTNRDDGANCNDGNPCQTATTCLDGVCGGGEPSAWTATIDHPVDSRYLRALTRNPEGGWRVLIGGSALNEEDILTGKSPKYYTLISPEGGILSEDEVPTLEKLSPQQMAVLNDGTTVVAGITSGPYIFTPARAFVHRLDGAVPVWAEDWRETAPSEIAEICVDTFDAIYAVGSKEVDGQWRGALWRLEPDGSLLYEKLHPEFAHFDGCASEPVSAGWGVLAFGRLDSGAGGVTALPTASSVDVSPALSLLPPDIDVAQATSAVGFKAITVGVGVLLAGTYTPTDGVPRLYFAEASLNLSDATVDEFYVLPQPTASEPRMIWGAINNLRATVAYEATEAGPVVVQQFDLKDGTTSLWQTEHGQATAYQLAWASGGYLLAVQRQDPRPWVELRRLDGQGAASCEP